MLSIMGERERTQKSMGMISIATYVLSPSFMKTQPYLVINYTCTIILYHRYYEYTISENTLLSIGITGYEYFHNERH